MSAVMDSVKSLLNAGLGFVYPELCQVCGEARATHEEMGHPGRVLSLCRLTRIGAVH